MDGIMIQWNNSKYNSKNTHKLVVVIVVVVVVVKV